jgi:FkbM family methyltransferase
LAYNFNECKINPGDVVLDVGANMGVFSRYAIANGAKKVYSFEPIQENYDLLKKNSNEFPIVPFSFAISNKNGTENFHIDSTEGGHTILDKDPNNSRTDEIREIDCYTLDYLFKGNWIPDKIDFLKIDVEGAEIKVLEGISDENLGKINKIAIEWHKFLFDDENLLDTIINRLHPLGFQFYIDYNSLDLDMIYFWK